MIRNRCRLGPAWLPIAARLGLLLAIGATAALTAPAAQAANCSAKAKAALFGKSQKTFEQSANYLRTIDGQLDKLCTYGRTKGIALDENDVKQVTDMANACPDPIIAAVLVKRRRMLEDYKYAVEVDCRNAQALKLDPKDAEAFYARGTAFAATNDNDRALADFTEAIRLNPHLSAAFYRRAGIYGTKGDSARAIGDYIEATRLDPKFGGNPYFIDGEAERTIAGIIADRSEFIRQDTKDASSYGNRAAAYYFSDDFDNCIRDATEAIRLDGNSKNASIYYNNRGTCALGKGDIEAALSDLEQAVRRNGSNAALHRNRGNAYLQKGDLDRALADLNEAIRLDPKQQPAFAYRGLVYERLGKPDNAIAEYKAALTLPADAFFSVGLRAHQTAGQRLLALMGSSAAPSVAAAAPAAAAPAVAAAPAHVTPAVVAAAPAASGRRIALVIGNSGYRAVAALANPTRDAHAIAQALRALGFDSVTLANDLARDRFVDALRSFATEAENADWAVIYFAGHGIEIGGVNYLVPIDARLRSDRDAQFEAVSLDQVLGAVEAAHKLRLVLLDACRDNPFVPQMRRSIATRSIGRGLARVEPGAGTLVAYAARDGQVALDGDGDHSPFVTALLNRIRAPGVEINKMFRLIHDDVMEATENRQEPYTYGALPGREDFYFVRQ